METAFGEEAKKYLVFGASYRLLGYHYKNMHNLEEAKNCFKTAFTIFHQMQDCDENQKIERISKMSEILTEIETKTSKTA